MENNVVDCYVGFLDILGFKNLIQKDNSYEQVDEIFKVLKSDQDSIVGFIEDNSYILNCDNEIDELKETLSVCKIYVMSDSIVISCFEHKDYSLEAVIYICLYFQIMLMKNDKMMFLRGAISRGSYFCDDTISYGKAMVDAYLIQENYAIYPRVIISGDLLNIKESNLLYDSQILHKDQEDKYHFIDYINIFKLMGENTDKLSLIINEMLDKYNERKIREKYIWLQKEFDRVINCSGPEYAIYWSNDSKFENLE